MKAALKKITDANFKKNADLKVQYIFESGYCFFKKSRAEDHAQTSKEKYQTIKRDTKADAKDKDKAEKLEGLKNDLEEHRTLLLDATEDADKAALEQSIEDIENEIKELED